MDKINTEEKSKKTKNNELLLCEKSFKLHTLLHRYQMHKRREQGAYRFQRDMNRILEILKLKEEIGFDDLAYVMGIPQQHLSELLNALESRDLAKQSAGNDGETVTVRITEKGSSHEKITEDMGVFDCLNSEEQTFFLEYLDRVADFLEERLEKDPEGTPKWDEDCFDSEERDFFQQTCQRNRMNHAHCKFDILEDFMFAGCPETRRAGFRPEPHRPGRCNGQHHRGRRGDHNKWNESVPYDENGLRQPRKSAGSSTAHQD